MARRDIQGVVDFPYLEDYAAGDLVLVEEVLGLFRQQAELWSPMLDPNAQGWRDAVHTLKGASRGVGAFQLGEACSRAEEGGPGALPAVRDALDLALSDIAAYLHELALRSLKSP